MFSLLNKSCLAYSMDVSFPLFPRVRWTLSRVTQCILIYCLVKEKFLLYYFVLNIILWFGKFVVWLIKGLFKQLGRWFVQKGSLRHYFLLVDLLSQLGAQPFDATGLLFGSQAARDYVQGSQPEWLHMQVGGSYERAT